MKHHVHADADDVAASALPFTEVMACLLFVTTMTPMIASSANLAGFSDRLATVNTVADTSEADHTHVITADAAGRIGVDGKPVTSLFDESYQTQPNPRLDEDLASAVAELRSCHPLLAIDRDATYERGLAVRTALQRLQIAYVEVAMPIQKSSGGAQ